MENISLITITLLSIYSIGFTILFFLWYRPFKNNLIEYLNKSIRSETNNKEIFKRQCINLEADKKSIESELKHVTALKNTFREIYQKNIDVGIEGRPFGFLLKSSANVEDSFAVPGILLKKSIAFKWADIFDGEEEKVEIINELLDNDRVPSELENIITDHDYLCISAVVEKNDENGEAVFERNRTYQEILNEFNDKFTVLDKHIENLVTDVLLAETIQKIFANKKPSGPIN
jgi:hypothetical protein